VSQFVATKPFCKPPPGENPKLIILDSAGTSPGMYWSYRACLLERGDMVVWHSVEHGDRLARVSRPDGTGPWDPVHIRLLRPVEIPNGRGSVDRRWGFTAEQGDLSEPSAVDLLADLGR